MKRIKFSDIKNDKAQAVESALDEGAHLELKDVLGVTPLMRAAYYCALDTARLLISRGANVNAQDIYKRTPLSWAALSIFYLEKEEQIYVEKRGNKYWVAGPQSKGVQKKERYKEVLATRKQYDSPHSYGASPQKVLKMIELLLENNANPDIKSLTYMSPLQIFAAHGFNKGIKALLKGGASLSGSMVLLHALDNGRLATAALLLKSGADINEKDRYGDTVLLNLVQKRNEEGVKWLLDNGADPNIAGYKGLTPLKAAEQSGEKKTAKLLKGFKERR